MGGELRHPVHPRSIFPRIVSAADIALRLAALDPDEGMYASDCEGYRSDTESEHDTRSSSPMGQPMDEAAEPLWEYSVTSMTDWEVSIFNTLQTNGEGIERLWDLV